MSELQLPEDLAEFLGSGSQLEFDHDAAEPGRLVLKELEDVHLGALYLNTWADSGHPPGEGDEADPEHDPHGDDHGYYVVPTVNLVASCEHYPPEHILTWIPSRRLLGTWDSGHLELMVFPNLNWSAVVNEPLRYINAQWYDTRQGPEGYYLSPWLYGYEFRRGSAPPAT